jgi:hypothetical protein
VTEIEAGGTAPACDLGLAGLKPSEHLFTMTGVHPAPTRNGH